MTDPESFAALFEEARLDTESLTVLIVAGVDVATTIAALGVDPEVDPDGLDHLYDDDGDHIGGVDHSIYAFTEIPGGVLALEPTGYADPHNDVLRELSRDGGRCAVVRSNIQAHYRFGCACDGELVFDDDEYVAIEDLSVVPPELRALATRANWYSEEEYADADPFGVGLAMAEVVTGLTFTTADLQRARAAGFHRSPSLTYNG